MSRENVELVRRALNRWVEVDEGLVDRQSLLDFYTPDATVDMTTWSGWLGQREFHGLDEFLEFRIAWMEPYDEWSYEPERILDAGANRVVVTYHQRGKPRDSDSWAEMHYAFVYTVEDGLISRAEVYATPEEALEAVGLGEMSRDNVDIAREAFEAFERTYREGTGDLYEYLDPDVEWLPIMSILEGTTYHGHEGVRQWIDDVKRDWAAFETKTEHFRDVGGERVLVLGAWRARGRRGDVLLDLTHAAWLLQLRNGKLIRLQTFTDRGKALEAAGLRE